MKRLAAFLSLFTSLSTLVCCALPALFVVLGFGAAFAGLVTAVPGLIWISEHKVWFFAFGGLMLVTSGTLRYRAQFASCPIGTLEQACLETKDWSGVAYIASAGLYAVGFFFAFVAPKLI